MDNSSLLREFLTPMSIQTPIVSFITNLLLTAILALILAQIYVKYGSSLSNKKLFARNFFLIAMTTMLIISIVKSSLALSLGLVGALSIIRFRAAIKEPEELTYLFLAIGIGLGFGANQGVITIIAFIIIAIIIFTKSIPNKVEDNQNLHLVIYSHSPKKVEFEQVIEILKENCSGVSLARFDEAKEVLEASFLVEFRNFEQLIETKQALQKLNDSLKITFLDNKGIM